MSPAQDRSNARVRRIFLQGDADDIQRLQHNAPEFNQHYPKHHEWLKMAIAEIVAGKRFAFGVYTTTFDAYGNPTMSLAGSIILKKETYTDAVQLKNLFIRPEDRGHGYGKALLDAAEQFCLKRGFTSIETEVPSQEQKTVYFLSRQGFYVLNLIESPYRKGDQIYRMYKHLPARYTGDPFDLFEISRWLFENLYGFRINAAQEPRVDFVSDFRSDPQAAIGTNGTRIEGSAYVIDTPTPATSDNFDVFQRENKRHLLAVVARSFTSDAERFCKRHRILGLSASTIEAQFRTLFAVGLHSFSKENIGGMIVPVNSKYATRLAELSPTPTYFKGGPIGKYLKQGDLVLFHVEDSTYMSGGGIHAYGEVATCETGSPQEIWSRYESKRPMFPKDDYFAWCADMAEVIALTFSSIVRIKPMRFKEVTATEFDAEQIGHFYLSRDETSRFRSNARREDPLANLDRSRSPIVFLSSTIEDLREERESVIRILREDLHYNVYASEAAGARQTAHPDIVQELRQAHVYVCLVGERYGFEIKVGGRTISATHDEFLQARNLGKPTLVYVKTVQGREKKAEDFLQEIGEYETGVKYQRFATMEELAQHLRHDVARIVGDSLIPPKSQET